MLCLDKSLIGLLGSSFFIGLFISLFFLPQLADKIGRRKVFFVTMVLTLFWQLVITFSSSFYLTMAAIFFCGMLWPGKNIVGLSYAEEFLDKKYSNDLLASVFVGGSGIMFFVPVIYLTISKSWVLQSWLGIGLTLLCLGIIPWYLPESPKYYYEKRMFDEARASLKVVARRNGVVLKEEIKFDYEDPNLKEDTDS